jgi:GTP-binding protein EngB required for normal cell division
MPMILLNPSQKQSILSGFLDVHRRMAELDAAITQSGISSPFSQHVGDLSPTEVKVVRDYFARIRTTMLSCLEEAGIPLEVRRTSLRWTLQVSMTFLHIAVAEMGPERLRGYGPLNAAAAEAVIKIQQDLYRLIDRLGAYLRQGLGRDLQQRLARLEATSDSVATLTLLDRIVTRWQLVEFRPVLDAIVRRLEAPQFEIAVFGRVSSGKSSLLNHVAGMDVLPVGVTPITAVPTRLVRGEEAAAVISFAEIEPRRIDVGQLRDYASEAGNPGNHKHVTNILVQLPSPRLREGVVLVDTPGIGSLALTGSAETFAYLPRCDLGVVLVDAASTLNQDDLGLLRTLYEAGIPAHVLVSKADLLTPADRERMASFLREQLWRELGLDLPVHLVSTVGPHEALLTEWFEREIEPLWDRHCALTEASLRRKIAHLRESVMAVLETLLARQRGTTRDGRGAADVEAARRLLDAADGAVRQAKGRLLDWTADEAALVEVILRDASRTAVASPGDATEPEEDPVFLVIRDVLTERSRMAHQCVRELQQTFGRTLEALRQSAPLADADPAAVRDLAFSGLPAPDPSCLRCRCPVSRPWWAALVPPAATWAARRALEKDLAPSLRQYVVLYDRQLDAWLKASVGQLIDLYEAQAEVFREQVRRLSADRDGVATADADALTADLEELRLAEGVKREEGHLSPDKADTIPTTPSA